MRTLVILSFFLSILAQAADLKLPTQGIHSFQGEFRVVQKTRYETVYSFTDAGRDRLEQLRKDGYSCMHKWNGIYLCSGLLPEDGTDKEVIERVQNKMQTYSKLEFFALRGDPSLISRGDSVEMWEVPQEVSFGGVTYQNYRYLITQGIHKIFLGEPAKETINIADDGTLTYPFLFPITESREVYFNYFVESFLRM